MCEDYFSAIELKAEDSDAKLRSLGFGLELVNEHALSSFVTSNGELKLKLRVDLEILEW